MDVLIKSGKPNVHLSKVKEEGKEQTEEQEAAEQGESEPIIHRPKGKDSAHAQYTWTMNASPLMNASLAQ